MANITPEFMQIVAAASEKIGGDLGVDTGRIVMDRRGLAYAGEHLRTLLGAMQMPPTALVAVVAGQTPHPDSVAIVAASSLRLNEAWSDIPDQVLAVRKLGYATDECYCGPPLDRRDIVLLVDSLLAHGDDFIAVGKRVRETGARLIGGFAIVDLQKGEDGKEAHKKMQEEIELPMFYAVTNKKQIIDYIDRQTMLGKK